MAYIHSHFLFSFDLSLAGIDGQLKIMFFGTPTKTADYSVNWHGRLWLACKKSFWPQNKSNSFSGSYKYIQVSTTEFDF